MNKVRVSVCCTLPDILQYVLESSTTDGKSFIFISEGLKHSLGLARQGNIPSEKRKRVCRVV